MLKSPGHILVVDDDREIRELLAHFLNKHGYRVTVARDGKEMRRSLADWAIDLIILDVMMPGEDGFSLCREIRAKSQIPVIMLTILGEETDRILGLEMGADDYLPKPFNPRELLARIRAVLRRSRGVASVREDDARSALSFSGWRLSRGRRCLESPDGTIVDLSTAEFDLLVAFAEHHMQVLTRDQLLDLAQGRKEVPFDRSIDMLVSRLRRKIEVDPKNPELIKTVRSIGYVFSAIVSHDETHHT